MKQTLPPWLWRWVVGGFLALVTAAAYFSVAENGFIILDDPFYVYRNAQVQQGLTWGTVHWAFVGYHVSNWHPLTWLSHALDCQLYGLAPAGHHLSSLVFHVANTVLLFFLLQKLTGQWGPAAFVAGMFGWHPMHVESVAWAAERKDVLSGFFFLLTLLAYARYAQTQRQKAEGRGQKVSGSEPFAIRHLPSSIAYLLALLCFALGLMSKSMLVTLPGVLLLLDYWPLKRVPDSGFSLPVWRRLIVEKIPFAVLSLIFCWVTIRAQAQGGAVVSTGAYPLSARLAQVPVAYVWYVAKLFWPTHLSVMYWLSSNIQDSFEAVAGAGLLLAGITAGAFQQRRQRPYLIVGWLWFLLMLVPVIGILQVGIQAYANRYTYLPYIGLLIMLAWGVPVLLGNWRWRRRALGLAAAGAGAAAFWLTVAQVHEWKNGRILFAQAVAQDPGNIEARYNLGMELSNQGNPAEAIECFQKIITRYPDYTAGWNALGRVYAQQGKNDAAQNAFETALSYGGDRQPETYVDLGDFLFKTGQPAAALANYESALRLQPNNLSAALGLAICHNQAGQIPEAIADYRRVLALDGTCVTALNNLAWLLATTADARWRNGAEAIRLAEQACQLTHEQQTIYLGTLAAAYAEAGNFAQAVVTAQRAVTVATKNGETRLAKRNGELLERYHTRQPAREKVFEKCAT